MNQMNNMKTTETYEIKIHVAGEIKAIETVCRIFCLRGYCVTVTPTNYIYTGGNETGAVVGIMNYARFSKSQEEHNAAALDLAKRLMNDCFQRSCSVVTPTETRYLENPAIVIPK